METFNGMEIIEQSATPEERGTRAGRILLIKRDCSHEPFITCWAGNGDSSWCWGHYYNTLPEAKSDFIRRIKRGF